MLALSEFGVLTGELAGDFDYLVAVEGEALLEGHFAPGQPAGEVEGVRPLTELEAGTRSIVSIERDLDAPGRLYYTLDLRYLTPAAGIEALKPRRGRVARVHSAR